MNFSPGFSDLSNNSVCEARVPLVTVVEDIVRDVGPDNGVSGIDRDAHWIEEVVPSTNEMSARACRLGRLSSVRVVLGGVVVVVDGRGRRG